MKAHADMRQEAWVKIAQASAESAKSGTTATRIMAIVAFSGLLINFIINYFWK